MTVNERLYLSRLFKKFEEAIKKNHVNKAVQILEEVELTEANITPILVKYGLNPNQ